MQEDSLPVGLAPCLLIRDPIGVGPAPISEVVLATREPSSPGFVDAGSVGLSVCGHAALAPLPAFPIALSYYFTVSRSEVPRLSLPPLLVREVLGAIQARCARLAVAGEPI